MKYVIAHIVKKDVIDALERTGVNGKEIVYADNVAIYDYKENGWKKSVEKRIEKNLKELLKDENEVYFISVGFIPVVLIVYDVLKKLKKKVHVLTYDKFERMYEEIVWE